MIVDRPTTEQPIEEIEALRRKLAELEDELDLSRAMVRAFPNGALIVFDHDLRYLVADGAGLANAGLSHEQLAGRTIWEAFPADICAEIAPSYRATLAGVSAVSEVPYGERIYEMRTMPITDRGGSVIAGMTMTQDITDRKQAEAALRATERELRSNHQQLHAIMANAPIIFYSLDRAGVIMRSEGKGLDALGLRPGQLVGQSVFDLYAGEPELLAEIRRAVSGEQFTTERTVSGRTFTTWYEPLRDEAGVLIGTAALSLDVTERARTEAERVRLQEEIIRVQESALRELSTPLIPISDTTMVMPLIGAMDSRRAQGVLETLLEGVAGRHARVAIIDITGVPVVDTQVASVLVRAAQAVRLLGAQVVLTGIKPEVAQTLVGLGVDLSGVTTRSTLQRGIAYAMGA